MRSHNAKGFTLVEVILSAVLVALLGGAIYLTLSQGVRIWNRAAKNRPEIDIYMGFEKLTDDLRNALKYSTGKFKGSIDSLEFYTQNSTSGVPGPMQVSYLFDRNKKQVKRTKLDYRQILNTVQTPSEEVIMQGITDATFSYYFSDRSMVGSWKNFWDTLCIPEAVRVSVSYKDQNQLRKATRTVIVPVGGCAVT